MRMHYSRVRLLPDKCFFTITTITHRYKGLNNKHFFEYIYYHYTITYYHLLSQDPFPGPPP